MSTCIPGTKWKASWSHKSEGTFGYGGMANPAAREGILIFCGKNKKLTSQTKYKVNILREYDNVVKAKVMENRVRSMAFAITWGPSGVR